MARLNTLDPSKVGTGNESRYCCLLERIWLRPAMLIDDTKAAANAKLSGRLDG